MSHLHSIRFRGYPTLLLRLRESGSSALRTSTPHASALRGWTYVVRNPSLLGVERVAQRRRLPVEVCQHPIGVREREIEDGVCCVLQGDADGARTVRRQHDLT